ncbi:MAG: SoxR reducing system RseC family protein [Bacteroidales bacterium]|jgi:sigma-E factor negative regulatory protein RseC|nr:SoxR reducing system RseC family protein [Bacteroidales bacterium]
MPSGSIIHPGIIESIQGDKVSVRILSRSACSSCHAKGACTIADIEEKIIEADLDHPGKWKPGDEVMVRMEESLGHKAVIMGYGLPLVVLVVSIVIFLSLFDHEGLAAILSVSMLVPYYFILYLFRKKLQKEFRFRIE